MDKSEIGIICACPESFESTWMPRHQVMTRLAKRHWTVWLEPASNWRLIRDNLSWPKIESDAEFNQLLRYFPGFLPIVFRPKVIGHFLDFLRIWHARRRLRKLGCKKIVLYLWRPDFAHYIKICKPDFCIYHIDDEYSFSTDETDTPPQEKELIESVDHVIIHSPGLLKKKGHINPSTTWVPNGVDFEEFSMPRSEPGDLAGVPRPRVGYVGVIKKQLDLNMIMALAKNRSDLSFVLVGLRGMLGSDEKVLDNLNEMPNVYELGRKEPTELPAYMQNMDVLMMCYKNDNYTKYIYPLKLHEYLAAGRPVVATPIQSIEEFSNIIGLANSEEQWLNHLRLALAPNKNVDAEILRRQATAKAYDWNILTDKISGIIDRLAS